MPEPHAVRAAEVRDDVGALDQRAADRPRLRVVQGHVRAAPRRVARRAEREAERRQPLVVQADQRARSERSTSRERLDARLGGDPHALLDRGEDEDRRRARRGSGVIPARARSGRSIANWSSWPNQPWIGVRSSSGARGDVEVAGRARAGVEVLVGAADGVASTPRASRSTGDRAGGVAEVPDDGAPPRANAVPQVGQRARAVGDVARARRARRRPAPRRAAAPAAGRAASKIVSARRPRAARDPLEHVAVGGEVVAVGHQRRADAVARRSSALTSL